jgi:hypothetical protein
MRRVWPLVEWIVWVFGIAAIAVWTVLALTGSTAGLV